MIMLGTASTPTQASEVASAGLIGIRHHVVNAGTMSTPPPMPSRPLSAPAPIPVTVSRQASRRGGPSAGWARPGAASVAPSALRTASGSGVVTGRLSRQAVKPTISAVRIISGCPPPGTAPLANAPPTAAAAPVSPVHATTRQSTRCSRAYRYAPVTADGMIDGTVEPIAAIGVAPSNRMAGVETTAPPIPNIPDKTPVPTPNRPVNTIRHVSDIVAEATLAPVRIDAALRGVYIPLITPFASDGSVALDALEQLARRYLDAGVAGLVPLGTTGETPLLEPDEQRAVLDVCAAACRAHGAHLIVGAGTNSTRATIAATEALGDVEGVTAALCVVPYYLRPSQAGIVAHFEAVAAASPVPLVLYNIPSRTGRVLEPDGLLRLANHPNVIGLKQSAGGLDDASLAVLADAPPGFAVLSGDDAFLFPLVLLGGAGAVAASAHVCTRRWVEMTECALAGKVDEGRAHHEALLPVVSAGFAEPNPAVFKGVLAVQGLIPTPDLRLPLTNASPGAVERALEAVTAAGG